MQHHSEAQHSPYLIGPASNVRNHGSKTVVYAQLSYLKGHLSKNITILSRYQNNLRTR